MKKTAAGLMVAAALAVSSAGLGVARADEPAGGEGVTPVPAPPPPAATPADPPRTADAGEAPDGLTFGVQASGGVGGALVLTGLGAPVVLGLPLSMGFAPGYHVGPLHLRVLVSFLRFVSRSSSESGGMTFITSDATNSLLAIPEVEWTLVSRGAVNVFLMVGGEAGVIWTVSRVDTGMTDTRTKDSAPAYGLLGGLGFRALVAPNFGVGASGGVQWMRTVDIDENAGVTTRNSSSNINAWGAVDLTVFFGK